MTTVSCGATCYRFYALNLTILVSILTFEAKPIRRVEPDLRCTIKPAPRLPFSDHPLPAQVTALPRGHVSHPDRDLAQLTVPGAARRGGHLDVSPTNRVRTLFTSVGNEADRVGPT
jgi:hypothetical protein